MTNALSIRELTGQVQLIQQAMSAVMKEGEHYGKIPGTDKPTLLKPGAEKLALLFRFDPEYDWKETVDGMHRTYVVKCTLYQITTGNRWASGVGTCSSYESKYRYRNAQRTCPECGKATIIKGREQYGGGWLCWKKNGGCGQTWLDGAAVIEGQEVGKVENENLADTWNTVLKMACKRALVAAILNGTAASDIFTQDLEEIAENAAVAQPKPTISDARADAKQATATVSMPEPTPVVDQATGEVLANKPMPASMAVPPTEAAEFTELARKRGWGKPETVRWARGVREDLNKKNVKDWSADDYRDLTERLKAWAAEDDETRFGEPREA